MYVCMYVSVCECVRVYVCTYVRMYVCMYARTYICMYVCMYVCMYAFQKNKLTFCRILDDAPCHSEWWRCLWGFVTFCIFQNGSCDMNEVDMNTLGNWWHVTHDINESCTRRKASQFYFGHMLQHESYDVDELSYVTCNVHDINGLMSQKKGVTVLCWSYISGWVLWLEWIELCHV